MIGKTWAVQGNVELGGGRVVVNTLLVSLIVSCAPPGRCSPKFKVVVIGSVSFFTKVMFWLNARLPVGVEPSALNSMYWRTMLSPGAKM